VRNADYTEQIARGWNTNDVQSDYCGFVTEFDVDDAYVARYPVQVVGGRVHEELWVPAEELDAFNRHILGGIRVVAAFYGEHFAVEVNPSTNLPKELGARVQRAEGSPRDQTPPRPGTGPGL
jgi:hypothetical protein